MNATTKFNKLAKVFFGALVLTVLAGCSTHKQDTRLDRISSDVQSLHAKTDRLSGEVNSMRSDVQFAKEEAARANQRLNNQARSYRK